MAKNDLCIVHLPPVSLSLLICISGTFVTPVFVASTGHEALEVVRMVNAEDQPFSFAFDEASCHSAGYEASLRIEPLTNTIPPKSRFESDMMRDTVLRFICIKVIQWDGLCRYNWLLS